MKRFAHFTSLALFSALFVLGCATTKTEQPSEPAIVDSPSVVAVVGDETITIDRFEQEYTKSVGSAADADTDSLAAYKDFLDRYVNFRLKVAEARAAGLAADPSIQKEIVEYRGNMARPYLIEQEILEPIMRKLFDRAKEVVNVSHILIRVDQDAPPEDTLAAYQRTAAIRDSLVQGADFGAMALRHSEDPSAKMAGRPGYEGKLGVIPPGLTVPEFEDMAYRTPEGEISPVFRTQFGYHVLRVNERNPGVPERRVAHIMLRPNGPSAQDTAIVLRQIEDIKSQLAAGEDFAELARRHSVHRQSAEQGGDIGFYFNYYQDQGAPEEFKNAVFALKEVGDVSDAVETPYGFHLIQLRDVKSLDSYEARRADLRQTASRLPQAQAAQQKFIAETQAELGIQVDTAAVYRILASASMDSLVRRIQANTFTEAELATTVAHLGDSTYTIADLTAFIPSARVQRNDDVQVFVRTVLDRFIDERTMDYAAATLEERDPEFGRIMKEFRDGLLLFRIMEDSVWTAAARDSVGLEQYYQAHAAKYRFPDRTRIVTFTAAAANALDAVVEALESGRAAVEVAAQVAADTTTSIRVDTTYLAGPTNSIYDRVLSLSTGQHSRVLPHGDNFIVLVRDGDEASRPMTFEEARAQVISDYQQVLEERLIERLRDAYNVRTYPDRLVRAFADEPEPAPTAAVSSTQK